MKKYFRLHFVFFFFVTTSYSQQGFINEFKIEPNDLELTRLAQPATPFNKVGQKFALLGFESGSFEAWAYPLKLLRNFEISFLIGSSTRPIYGKDIVRYISVKPEATTLTFTYQSFRIDATYITAIHEAGALILLHVESTEPLTIVCGFLPVLQPMWPAGIGGQYAYWDDEMKAYIISESTRKNHGFIGSPSASGISYTPAHMLSDVPNEFKIELKDPSAARGKFIPICVAGGIGNRDSVKAVYKKLLGDPEKYYRSAYAHYKNLRESTLQVETPVKELNLAFEWAKVSLDNLIVDHPTLGKGLIAGLGASGTSGRPGFGWFFSGDAYINSLAFNSYGAYETVRDALKFTQKWQRKDGKMAHELSQAEGYIDWWGNYPYGYIHGDTTPFYIVAMHDYFTMTGDTTFIRESWSSILKAYQWCLSTDANGDGLMDNAKAGLASVEYGALTNLATDSFLGAITVKMLQSMNDLAIVMNEKLLSEKVKKEYEQAAHAYNEKFWDKEEGIYSNGFNDKGEHIKEVTPWIAVGSIWGIGEESRRLASLERLCSSDMTTDWGMRSISNKSKHYGALNYNYGAIWPFLTGFTALAQFKHHFMQQPYLNLLACARHTFDNNLGCITEVFSGSQNVWPQEAVSQQGFSSTGFALPFVRGLLGLEGDAVNKTITFAPNFPADWNEVKIKNYRVGNAKFDITYSCSNRSVAINVEGKNCDDFILNLRPAFSIGTEIKEMTVNEFKHPVDSVSTSQGIIAKVDSKFINQQSSCNISFEPRPVLLPQVVDSKTGNTNHGLKIISMKRKKNIFHVSVEGLSGATYQLNNYCGCMKLPPLRGAGVDSSKWTITMPKGKPFEFVKSDFEFDLK